MTAYNPEIYWSRVAQEIGKRGESYVAGDDNPYYRYKRRKFLQEFLGSIDFHSKTVLEVGFGPGGNLKYIATHHSPRRLLGVDISQTMLEIATKNLGSLDVELKKTDGVHLPYADRSVDVSFTVTVLQHTTDETMLRHLVQEICRVTTTTVILMEDIGGSTTLGSEASWIGRQVDAYRSLFAEFGFQLTQCQFLNTRISRLWCRLVSAAYARVSTRHHREGDPIGTGLDVLIGLPLRATRVLDRIFVDEQNLARMVFHRV